MSHMIGPITAWCHTCRPVTCLMLPSVLQMFNVVMENGQRMHFDHMVMDQRAGDAAVLLW